MSDYSHNIKFERGDREGAITSLTGLHPLADVVAFAALSKFKRDSFVCVLSSMVINLLLSQSLKKWTTCREENFIRCYRAD